MKRLHRTRSSFVAAVAAGAACAGSPAATDYHKGLDLALFSQTVDPSRLNFFLDNAAAMGVDHLSINSWWFQDNINSMQIAPNFSKYSASDDTIRQVIDAAHARGMAVQLRPIVDLANDPSHWRGEITGGTSWFNNSGGYGDYIRHMADIAQAKNVELFSTGVELETVQTQEASWRNLVSDVRSRFAGQLVYGANWGNPAVGNTVNWWDAVDYVGIDAYYPLTGVNNPTPAQLLSAWTTRANQIESWRNSVAPNKQVLFTEVGYQALDGANVVPYGASSSTVDMREQADCYQALLTAMSGRTWFSGAYWWAWDPNNLSPGAGDYESLAKPAYDVMGSFYVSGYTIGGTWTGAGGANWSNASSWSNGAVPGNLTAVTFNSNGGGNTNINLGGAINLARITFDTSSAAAHTFQPGGTITLNAGGGITITNTVTTTQTFNNAFALSGPAIFANWSMTNLQRLTINGPITSAAATRNQLALFGNGSGQLNGVISDGAGTIALFKGGDGTWTVSGNNSYSGETYVGAGNLQVAHNDALGSTVSGTIVASGASLQINANVSVGAEPLTISGVGAGGQGALQLLDQVAPGAFGGDITIVGDTKFANRSFNNGSAIFTLGGKLRGGSTTTTLTLWGSNSTPGFFRLTGTASDFTGTTLILGTKVILAGGDNTLSPATVVNLDTNGLSNNLDAGVLDLNGTNQAIAGLTSVSRATLPRIVNRATGTLKSLTINASNNFSFAGAIRNDTGQIALTKTGAGNQTLSGANTYTGGTTVNGGTLTLANILAAGTGTLNVNAGRAVYTAGLPGALRLAAISVATATGAIDLNDNDLVVGPAQPQLAIEALIVSARNGGQWTGGGLTSTSAKNHPTHSTTLGVINGAQFFSIYGAGATFGGQSIGATDTLVKYTWYGDADFSGGVNFDDYSRIDTGFNNGFTGWINGDFDLSGTIDFDDYSLIDLAFNVQSGVLRSVPEPSALILFAASAPAVLTRRRRDRELV